MTTTQAIDAVVLAIGKIAREDEGDPAMRWHILDELHSQEDHKDVSRVVDNALALALSGGFIQWDTFGYSLTKKGAERAETIGAS